MNGPNTFPIPGLIAVSINPTSATLKNIRETKEFGVSLAANDQNILASVSGGSTGTETDKIKVLEELGFEFYKAKNIDVMMVKGAALNLECKLIKEIELGSHIMFVGEVVDVIVNDKEPLGMHKGRYWKMETPIEKPPQKELDKINKITEKHSK